MKNKLLKNNLYNNSISIIVIKNRKQYGAYITIQELKKRQTKLDDLIFAMIHTLKKLKLYK